MIVETTTSIFEVNIEFGTLPKKSGLKILNQPLIIVRKIATIAGASSAIPDGRTFVGDRIETKSGMLSLYNGDQQELETTPIVRPYLAA